MIARANANRAVIPFGEELPPMTPRPERKVVTVRGKAASKSVAKRRTSSARFKLLRRFWNCATTPKLPHAGQAVWCYMWSLADGQRQCFPSLQRIADRLGCSRRYTQKVVSGLIELGYLAIVRKGTNRGRNRANVYRIAVPKGELECASQ